jgi:hypothetical protein
VTRNNPGTRRMPFPVGREERPSERLGRLTADIYGRGWAGFVMGPSRAAVAGRLRGLLLAREGENRPRDLATAERVYMYG